MIRDAEPVRITGTRVRTFTFDAPRRQVEDRSSGLGYLSPGSQIEVAVGNAIFASALNNATLERALSEQGIPMASLYPDTGSIDDPIIPSADAVLAAIKPFANEQVMATILNGARNNLRRALGVTETERHARLTRLSQARQTVISAEGTE